MLDKPVKVEHGLRLSNIRNSERSLQVAIRTESFDVTTVKLLTKRLAIRPEILVLKSYRDTKQSFSNCIFKKLFFVYLRVLGFLEIKVTLSVQLSCEASCRHCPRSSGSDIDRHWCKFSTTRNMTA